MDEKHGKDGSVVAKTGSFNLPVRKNRKGEYKIPSGEMVYTCFTSDFLLDEAWRLMKLRSDLKFLFVTKRIDRLKECMPLDRGQGYAIMNGCWIYVVNAWIRK